ncbi:MAG: class I SAM-dependent methyltransferase, partial [Nitrospira sp.]|nr:class I SAM-dependent methyltransferase [Nitrospira sp.]
MERFVALLPLGGSVLDLGCGSGQPLACHLLDRGFTVFGVDSSPTLISKCRSRFPKGEWTVADMRTLSINRRFEGVIAWDSFFHLSHEDQRAMFVVFREHANCGAPLLFTTGTGHGEAIGSFQGESLYHASLSPGEYRTLMKNPALPGGVSSQFKLRLTRLLLALVLDIVPNRRLVDPHRGG